MKNEREKEIEHVRPLNRYCGGFFKQRDKQDSKLQININKTQTFQSPGPKKSGKTKGEVYVVNHKKKEAKEKNGIG